MHDNNNNKTSIVMVKGLCIKNKTHKIENLGLGLNFRYASVISDLLLAHVNLLNFNDNAFLPLLTFL